MTTIVTPPPAPPAPDRTGRSDEPIRPPSGSSRVVAIALFVLGGLILVGAVTSSVLGTISAASTHTSSRTLPVDGVTDLRVQVDAGSIRVEFADVDEAELDVRSSWGIDNWTLRRDGGQLVVASPSGWWNGWFGGWLGGNGSAALRLPMALEGMDADLGLAAGDLIVDGEFGDLDLQVDAGRADVSGSARAIEAQLSAGGADVDLADVDEATVTVNAGSLDAVFTGSAPRDVSVEVNAGSLNLTVPEGDYDVSSDVAAGDFDNRIGSTPDASNTIRVSVSAGDAVLRAR